MPELDEKKRIIAYDTVNDPDENYYALIDNGTAGTGKVSIKGLGPADMISDQYSDSSTYKVGDLCIHNNKLYVCTVAINTPHAFNLSEWELDTLGNYASEIKQSLSNLGSWSTKPWTATSSTAINTQLTDKITLNKGKYVLIGSTPSCSTDQVFIELASSQTITIVTGIDLYTVTRSYNHFVFPFEVLTDNTDVWLKTSSSATVNFTQPSRGYIRAIRIA